MKISLNTFVLLGSIFSLTVMIMTGCQIVKESETVNTTELTFYLNTDKKIYKSEEKVLAKLLLKNTGTEAVWVNKRMACNSKSSPEGLREITFRMVAPSGEELDFDFAVTIYARFTRPEDFIELQPNKSIEGVCEISWYYNLDQEGTYSIQAFYENQSDPENGKVAWKGELASEIVTFNIVASD